MLFIVADDSWKIVAFVVFLVIAIAVVYFEFRYLRRKRESRMSEGSLEDQAHNAIVTTRAISSTLARGGVRSGEAIELLRKAERAKAAGSHREAIDYASSAKGALLKEKQRQRQMGDVSKMPKELTDSAPPSEETTKEKLQKEIPKNFMQAKFMLSFAQKAIDEGVREGRSMAEAGRLLSLAQKSFDDRDYDSCLKLGVQVRRAAESIAIEMEPKQAVVVSVAPETKMFSCRSCGASLMAGDTFCRKCGVKVELAVCPSCGTIPRKGDSFCRKCGVTLG